jgi:alpha-beta hydrolase superfamily lysophospholipase
MQSNNEKLNWKKLSDGVFVTHFSSTNKKQQIYLKQIKATKKSKNPITIFLFHDLASYHGRFMNLVNWFRVQHPEINFVMMDFMGHGLSSGTRAHVENFNDLVTDMADVFHKIDKNPDEKWIGLGHGIGALCLLDLLGRFEGSIKEKIDQLILSNFVLQFSSNVLRAQSALLDQVILLSDVMKTTRPLEIYKPSEILSHPQEQSIYMDDPLIVRKPTFQTFKSVQSKSQSIYQDAYFLDKPVLVLHSESPYLNTSGMNSFSKGFKKGLLVEKKYSNLKHDLYNERDNLAVFNDIAQWIQS